MRWQEMWPTVDAISWQHIIGETLCGLCCKLGWAAVSKTRKVNEQSCRSSADRSPKPTQEKQWPRGTHGIVAG
jgi:hypothetical protein